MEIERAGIADVLIIGPKKHGDARGFLSETFKASALKAFGVDCDWVQDNHSLSARRGVVRGLHFQAPPHAQAKIVRVTRGAIFDVAVDLRKGSASYGRHVGVELSAENWRQLYLPPGFAHGFCTLSADTEVLYRASAEYAPHAEYGLAWDDPALGIEWPIGADEAQLSERDLRWPPFGAFTSPF